MEVTNLPLDDGWHAFGTDGGTNLFSAVYDWRFDLPKTDHRRGGVAQCTVGTHQQQRSLQNRTQISLPIFLLGWIPSKE